MFQSSRSAILRSIALFVCLLLVSGCGASISEESTNGKSSNNWGKRLSENDLFELRVTLKEIANWGLVGAKEDDFIIKSYSDSKRQLVDSELISVIPDYCLPTASLILDSKESGADLYSYYTASTDVFNYFAIGTRVFSTPELARSKFDSMLSTKEKCNSWVPKFSSGLTDSEWNLGIESTSSTSDAVYWEYEEFQQAWAIVIVGATIYELSVAIDDNLPKAITIREQARRYFDKALKEKQL